MPKVYKLSRWARMARAILPDVVGGLVVVGATAGGFIVSLLAHPDACVDRRPLFLTLTGEGVLLIGAVAFLLIRGAQLRASGTTVLLLLGSWEFSPVPARYSRGSDSGCVSAGSRSRHCVKTRIRGDKEKLKHDRTPEMPARPSGGAAWITSVAALLATVVTAGPRLPSVKADWTLLFTVFSVGAGATAMLWPERKNGWRGHRLSLAVALTVLAPSLSTWVEAPAP